MNDLDLGHYARYYAWNDIVGHCLGLNFRTNYRLSPNFTLKGWLAYGTRDTRFKCELEANQVLSRKFFTKIGFWRSGDKESQFIFA